MEDMKEKRIELREEIIKELDAMKAGDKRAKTREIELRLFEFANFLEARIALLYIGGPHEAKTIEIIKKTFDLNKLVILPEAAQDNAELNLVKVDNPETDLKRGEDGTLRPDPERCRTVPIDCIDIAIIPGLVFDEKGGRIGNGNNDRFYNRLISKLPITTRKVSLAFENQIVPQVPMEPNDKHVDIIISDERIIYKI